MIECITAILIVLLICVATLAYKMLDICDSNPELFNKFFNRKKKDNEQLSHKNKKQKKA